MMMREEIDRKEDFLLLDRCRKGVKLRVDLLTIAAKIAIISDISTCKGLLFCELTHESGGFALPLLNERVSFSRLFKVRGVFQPIGHDKRTTSDKDCVVFLCTALGCPNSGGNIGINGTH